MGFIQLQAVTEEPIGAVIDPVRTIVSSACGGIDDMRLLGRKALVVRAEIALRKVDSLLGDLDAAGIRVRPVSLPEGSPDDAVEHVVTLQVTSYSPDTDGRTDIPAVPG